MKNNLKNIIIILILFSLFVFITLYSYAHSVSEDLSNVFFRFHIIANSDSKEDQELKLKVRDEIIKYMKTIIDKNSTKDDIISTVKNNLDILQKITENTIFENGYSYPVKISVKNDYFPTKSYGNVLLPAGYYDCLKIEIGESEGHNWWCSLFPPLCFIDISSGIIEEDGKKYLSDNLSDEELNLILTDSDKVELKFKIVEFFNSK